MKTLLILRHGAAEHGSPSGDWGRALTVQGAADAFAVGKRIGETFGIPQAIITSDAVRARQTAETVASALGFSGTVLVRNDLYQADVQTLLDVVQNLPEDASLALLIGHNPGLERFAAQPLGTARLAALQWDTAHWTEALPQMKTHLSFPN